MYVCIFAALSMQSQSEFSHMTATGKPRPSAIVSSGSAGIAELAVQHDTPTKMVATRARSVGESPHTMAVRLNRTSSTLMLNSPVDSRQYSKEGEESGSGERGSAGTTPSVDMFSFAGLPPGPAPMHLAAKYVCPLPSPPLPSPPLPSPPLPSPLIP